MRGNWFYQVLRNPTSKPHKMNIPWPLTVAVEALREAAKVEVPALEPSIRLFILTDQEMEFIARAVDQSWT